MHACALFSAKWGCCGCGLRRSVVCLRVDNSHGCFSADSDGWQNELIGMLEVWRCKTWVGGHGDCVKCGVFVGKMDCRLQYAGGQHCDTWAAGVKTVC